MQAKVANEVVNGCGPEIEVFEEAEHPEIRYDRNRENAASHPR